jgi:hypothetical protein
MGLVDPPFRVELVLAPAAESSAGRGCRRLRGDAKRLVGDSVLLA